MNISPLRYRVIINQLLTRRGNTYSELVQRLGFSHGGKSRDFRILKMADSCQNPSIEIRLSLIFPLNTDQIGMGFKADTPEK